MIEMVTVEEIFKKPDAVLIDVRTKTEYTEGTIPGAINLPLFDEAERSEIGIIYRMLGPEKARMRGLALASPKLVRLAELLQPYRNRELVLFCWRGGLRSQALASVLKLAGFQCSYLKGGYKAYRRHVISYLAEYQYKQKFVVLEGLTGVGKTEVIQFLKEMKEPAIDLEDLAGHRGSVFGHIGFTAMRSQKDFEALLALELERLKESKYLIVECESRRIGNIYLPTPFFEAMQRGTRILLYDRFEERVKRLVATYLATQKDNCDLENAVSHLQVRLGKRKTAFLCNLLNKQDYEAAVGFLLREYYDPLYHFPDGPSESYPISVCSRDPVKAAWEIKKYLKKFIKFMGRAS
ncbi:MAG: tRNA 2-selenouridine(34) synthase MnmH [Firmicutes bacterium]|nr:tRNA 2-selenouridine(34) synthase MnmH [Bacillota bacterium]